MIYKKTTFFLNGKVQAPCKYLILGVTFLPSFEGV